MHCSTTTMSPRRNRFNQNPLKMIANTYRPTPPPCSDMIYPAYSMTGSFPTEDTTSLTDFGFYLKQKRDKENHQTCIGGHRVLPDDCLLVSCLLCSPKWNTQAFDQYQPHGVMNNVNIGPVDISFEFAPNNKSGKKTKNCTSLQPLMRAPSILFVPTFNQDGNKGQYAELPIRKGTGREIYHAIIAYYDDKFKKLDDTKGDPRVNVRGILPAKTENVGSYYILMSTVELK